MLKQKWKRIKALAAQKTRRTTFVLQTAAAVLIYSCGGELQTARQDSTKPAHENVFGESGEKGLFRAYLTDFPIGNSEVTKVLVTIDRVEIHSDEMGWLTVAEYPDGRVYNLLDLQDGKTEDLGELSLEPGKYTQIRIILNSENQIEVDEGNGPELKPLTIPSGEQTGIKLVHPFEVPVQGVTSLTLDFNAEKSVLKAGSNYKLKPTIKVIDAETTPGMSKLISAENGGDLVVLGKVEVNIPPGALSEDTRIEIVPKKAKDEPPMFNSFIQQEDIFDLQPDGLQFNKDVTISMNYDETAIAAAGLNEKNATPFYYNEEGRFWQVMEGEAWENHDKVVFLTNHFTNFTIAASGDQTLPSITPASVDEINTDINNGPRIEAPKSISATVVMPAIPENAGVTIEHVSAFYADSYPGKDVDGNPITKYRTKEVTLKPGADPTSFSGDIVFSANSNYFRDLNDVSRFFVYIKAVASNGSTICAPAIACPTDISLPPADLVAMNLLHEHVYDSDMNAFGNLLPNIDGNGVTDLWEYFYELTNVDVVNADSDLDGVTDIDEYAAGTSPRLSELRTTYWEQRLYLLNRLIEVGAGDGNSLVSSGAYEYYSRGENNKAVKKDYMAWADTGVKHGWYLGILATEHSRIRMEAGHLKAEPTLHELYFALKAIERLDRNAELFHTRIYAEANKASGNRWPNGKDSVNGFLMRDDMTYSAYEDYYSKKPIWAELPSRGSSESMHSEGTLEHGGKNVDTNKFIPPHQKFLAYEISQDQYVHLYMGLALVRRFIPASATVNGENIRKLAQRIENRIYHSFLAYNPLNNSYVVDSIRNPVTGHYVHTGAEIALGGQQICITHQYVQTGWYSHNDKHNCWVKHPIDGRGFAGPHAWSSFYNLGMSMQLTSYSNWDDTSSYWIGSDQVFSTLELFELDRRGFIDPGKVKRNSQGNPICTTYLPYSCKTLFNMFSERWALGRSLASPESDDRGYADDTLAYINMFEWESRPVYGRFDTWYDAEEVFGLVNIALYNKTRYYQRSTIQNTMKRLNVKTTSTSLNEGKASMQIVNEGKLELLLLTNLYEMQYNKRGTAPPQQYADELKRHLERSQSVIDVNNLNWTW